jgi:hypothetical protein
MHRWALAGSMLWAVGCGAPTFPEMPWDDLDRVRLWPRAPAAPGEGQPPAWGESYTCTGGHMGPDEGDPQSAPASLVRLGGRGWQPQTLLVTDQQTPSDAAFVPGCGDGSVHLLDLAPAAPTTRNLVQRYCFHRATVLHRRFALGGGASRASCEAFWQLVTLHPVLEVRRFDKAQVLGPHVEPQAVRWVEGLSPVAYAVLPAPAGAEVVAVDLETNEALWRALVPGARWDRAIADEHGRLFLGTNGTGPGTVHALDVHGQPLWSRDGLAAPLAVFAQRLVLASGEVLDAGDGTLLYGVPVDRVLLSATMLVSLTPCGPGCVRLSAWALQEGQPLFDAQVPAAGPAQAVVTRDEGVVVLDAHTRADQVGELRIHQVGRQGQVLTRSEQIEPGLTLNEAVLFDGVVAMRASVHAKGGALPSHRLITAQLPGVRPAESGWLGARGDASGTYSPE